MDHRFSLRDDLIHVCFSWDSMLVWKSFCKLRVIIVPFAVHCCWYRNELQTPAYLCIFNIMKTVHGSASFCLVTRKYRDSKTNLINVHSKKSLYVWMKFRWTKGVYTSTHAYWTSSYVFRSYSIFSQPSLGQVIISTANDPNAASSSSFCFDWLVSI